MTFQNGQNPQGQPGQVPPPPQQKKPTRNKLNGWLYVGLGVIFILLGVLGFVGDTRGAFMNWLFIILGVANGIMGVREVINSRKKQIDPFSPDNRSTP
ncbi:hypothetical protein NF556_08010 [Ornithinimicrobium faecis]|uniref:DUF2631 domain-containing protein n=1 Tax=Ornithinimicrobium faecis TaxID=2934158 RepID=A0ABY4YXR7_9MICO|nr:hypothetical protein [Ornithinimicrobium sp. HY1793]USQ81578.1 hypothetical protein NF556_08010 [Ornithinimicrobium sp. HY1793]